MNLIVMLVKQKILNEEFKKNGLAKIHTYVEMVSGFNGWAQFLIIVN